VALDGLGEPSLLRGGEERQGARQSEGQPAAIDARAQIRREAAREGEAALDPGGLLAQELGDQGHRVPVVMGEGKHDAGFVHGAGGFGRLVGDQQAGLHRRALDGLHNDGDLLATLGDPGGQTLEAVEDLVGTVGGPGDAQRQGCQLSSVRVLAAQGSEGRAKAFDRDVDHFAGASSGSNWKRGYR
jgi:hypothetical protein